MSWAFLLAVYFGIVTANKEESYSLIKCTWRAN